jgi:hypothetical protein
MMPRLTAKERREKAAALLAAVEQSRREWLGKRVRFTDLLDTKTKVGVFREITDDGSVILEYQMFPWWPDEPPATLLTSVGHEQELLDMVNGVVIED